MRNSVSFATLFIGVLAAADQLSKYLIRHSSVSEGGFYVCNKGIAFGINIPEYIFLTLWVLIFGAIVFYALRNKSEIFILSLIIAGALSNMIDRLLLGCVVDFIDLKIWPVFNLADAFITIGAILLIVSKIKNKK